MTKAMHFYPILKELRAYGKLVNPRGEPTIELTDFSYVLPPRVRFMCFDSRKLKLDYVKQEFLWYLRGERTDVSIRKLAAIWDGIINVNGTINSNYGHYIFNSVSGDGVRSNFLRVVQELARDPQSRRATICILGNEHLNSETKDYPCTCYLNFHVRNNELVMYVRMRSQDAIFGMGNDAPCFSFVHELMWSELLFHIPELKLGEYRHCADSFHVYQRHWPMLDKILGDPVITTDYHETCPLMTPTAGSSLLSELRRESIWVSRDRVQRQVSFHPFTQWLLSRDDPKTLLAYEAAGQSSMEKS